MVDFFLFVNYFNRVVFFKFSLLVNMRFVLVYCIFKGKDENRIKLLFLNVWISGV